MNDSDLNAINVSNDITALRKLAERLANALYYGTVKSIGTNNSISPGIRHDDYDFLNRLANRMEVEKLETRLKELKGKS